MIYLTPEQMDDPAYQDAGILMDAFAIQADPVRCRAAMAAIRAGATQLATVHHYLSIRTADEVKSHGGR